MIISSCTLISRPDEAGLLSGYLESTIIVEFILDSNHMILLDLVLLDCLDPLSVFIEVVLLISDQVA